MSDRLDYYFRQRVSEAELDLGFELLEKADRNLAADIGLYGIVSGAVPAAHAPIADLTIDLTAPMRAYDRLGQRIFFGTPQRVDISTDSTGIPTEVSTVGQERWVGVFLRFKRLLSDPRTDGNSLLVYFRRDESFELVVRQGPPGPAGAAPKLALVEGELLVCDVRRSAGQTQVANADIDVSRRQAFVFAKSDAVAVVAGLWKAINTAATTVQLALDSVDAILAGHTKGTSRRHASEHIDYVPHGFVAAKTVRGALDEIIDDLASAKDGSAGAARVGADAVPGVPLALPAGSVDGQLSQILAWLNAHIGAAAGAHAASAISAAPHAFIAATSVQAQLQEIVVDLQSAAAGQGAALVGSEALGGTPRAVTATTARAQLGAILDHLNAHIASGDHDARYLHQLYSGAFVMNPSETRTVTVMTEFPTLVTVAYNLVDSADKPVQPQYHAGPYTPLLNTWVDKLAAAGPTLFLKNGSTKRLHVTVNAYVQ